MIYQIILLLQKDIRELTRDRGFIFFVLVWCLVIFVSQIDLPHHQLDRLQQIQADELARAENSERTKKVDVELTGIDTSSVTVPRTAPGVATTADAETPPPGPVKTGISGDSDLIRTLLAKDPTIQIEPTDALTPKEAINKKIVETMIVISPGLENVGNLVSAEPASLLNKRNPRQVKVLTKGYPDARANIVVEALNKVDKQIVDLTLRKSELSNQWWERQITTEEPIRLGKFGHRALSGIASIPFLMVFAVTMVTTVFSIELICAENVRGTLALLIAAPINRLSILVAKTLLVSLTAFSSLASAITMAKRSLSEARTGVAIDTSTGVMTLAVPLIIIIASWSVFMSLRYRTRGTALARLLPGAIVLLALTGIAILPGVHTSIDIAIIPIAGIAELIHDYLAGKVNYTLAAVAISCCFLYGFLSMRQAAIMLDDYGDAGSQTAVDVTLPGSGFQLAVGLFVVSLLANFYLVRQVIICDTIAGAACTTATALVLAALALFIARRFPIFELFNVNRVTLMHAASLLLAAVVVAAGYYTHTLSALNPFRPLVHHTNLFLVGLLTFVLPISKELLFRVVFQTLLSPSFGKVTLPIVIGLLSGICQPYSASFLPAALFGALLSFVATTTRSIYPCIVLHVLVSFLSLDFSLLMAGGD